MSHVADIGLLVKDLKSLEKACKTLGLELVRGQQTYKWYGRSVGDTPLPAGFKESDLGKCEHAIRIPGNSQAYEIGVVKRRDGKAGYQLLWDSWNNGYGIVPIVGKAAEKLKHAYSHQLTLSHYRQKGYRITEKVKEDGTRILTATR